MDFIRGNLNDTFMSIRWSQNGGLMHQPACEETNSFSDKVSWPIPTKNSHLSNISDDNFLFDSLKVPNTVEVHLYVSHSAHY